MILKYFSSRMNILVLPQLLQHQCLISYSFDESLVGWAQLVIATRGMLETQFKKNLLLLLIPFIKLKLVPKQGQQAVYAMGGANNSRSRN